MLKTSRYLSSFASTALTSSGVGFAGSPAGGRAPNFIKQAMSSKRAFVEVRLLPAMDSGLRACSTNPAALPLPTFTKGMPQNVARFSAASTELLIAPKGAEPSATEAR